jgi:hypothetical protein
VGAWGARAFENDGALDWVWELEAAEDDSVLRSALSADVSEAPEAEIALAAAEVVAAALGRPAGALPDEVTAWVAAHGPAVGDDLQGLAQRAVAAASAGGELRELWTEAGDPEWEKAMGDLQARLA